MLKSLRSFNTEDWWSVIIGLFFYFLCLLLAFVASASPELVTWDRRPWSAFDDSTIAIEIPILFFLISLTSAFALRAHRFTEPPEYARLVLGCMVIWLLTLLSKLIGAQSELKKAGIGAALWTLVLGALVSVVSTYRTKSNEIPLFLKNVCASEFYIKISVVLLVTSFSEIGRLGLGGLAIACIDTPLVILAMYWTGKRYFKSLHPDLCIILGVGTAVCGSSAATAISTAIHAEKGFSDLAIGVMSVGTIPLIPTLSFILSAIGLIDEAAGGTIGGSVDSTGAVVACASVAGGDVLSTATIVKMLQNTFIGVITLIIAYIWERDQPEADLGKTEHLLPPSSSSINRKAVEPKKCSSLVTLWDKFPKFVIGFLITSFITSVATTGHVEDQVLSLTFTCSEWFANMGFVCIGMDVMRIWAKVRETGKAVAILYLLGQSLDVLLTGVVSFVVFQLA